MRLKFATYYPFYHTVAAMQLRSNRLTIHFIHNMNKQRSGGIMVA